ncbi:MAG: alpha/beta fold hydrolase, partial [Actinomycetaceae bacterium]|nr:alpha/beta fold hydrolase [Actinomycetaceae bacterium]
RLVFFQGGPGSSSSRLMPTSSWLDVALEHYRVVLIDQRGTGNSTPLDYEAMSLYPTVEEQAAFLSCFRQDSIVADAEILRRELQGDKPREALGQSFGGFCVTNYLSQAPEGLARAFIAGGLPALDLHADDVYVRTYQQTAQRNKDFFARYPEDEETAWYIATHLADVEEVLPDGTRLTSARFRQLGRVLGFSYGMESLHFLLDDPVWNFKGQRRLRPQFLSSAAQILSMVDRPLYAVLQESIYAQASTGMTSWSAERVRAQFPEFALPPVAAGGTGEVDLRKEGHGFRFTGEHIYRSHFVDDVALQGFSPIVDALAFKADWPELYSPAALTENTVPTAAYIYEHDMYVPYELSMRTAEAISGLVPIVSSTLDHDALRNGGRKIVERLLSAV